MSVHFRHFYDKRKHAVSSCVNYRMKDLLLDVHSVVKIINLEFSRRRLADCVKELCYSACLTGSTIIFPHSTNEIIVFWRRRCRRLCLGPVYMGGGCPG